MTYCMFTVGQRVRVIGDKRNFTERIAAQLGTITHIENSACFVKMDNGDCYVIWDNGLMPIEEGEECI